MRPPRAHRLLDRFVERVHVIERQARIERMDLAQGRGERRRVHRRPHHEVHLERRTLRVRQVDGLRVGGEVLVPRPDDADDRAPGTGVAEAQRCPMAAASGQNRRARVSSTTTTSGARSIAGFEQAAAANLVPTASKYPGVTARTLATSFGSSGPARDP